jgi:adenine-specific DNA-methyltransferase
VPTSVIAALLNSAAADVAFRCLNGSVAVSAFELEELPLPEPVAMAKLAGLIETGALPAKIEEVVAAAYGQSDAAAAA